MSLFLLSYALVAPGVCDGSQTLGVKELLAVAT